MVTCQDKILLMDLTSGIQSSDGRVTSLPLHCKLTFSKDLGIRVIFTAVKIERKLSSALQTAVMWYDRTTALQNLPSASDF